MNVSGEFTESYEEANRILRENWRDETGVVRCPECRLEAIDWYVRTGKVNSLTADCEYCNLKDWAYFREEPPWVSEAD